MSVDLLDSPQIEHAVPSVQTLGIHPISPTLLSQDVSDWTALFNQDQEATALQHPQFVLTECRNLPSSRLDPLLLTDRNHDEQRGAALLIPKVIRTSQAGAIGPGWKLHGYRLAGGRMLASLANEDAEARLFAAAIDAVSHRRADFLMIEDMDQASSLWRRVGRELPPGWGLFAPNGYQARLRIQFPHDGSDYWSQQFSSKTRSTFRRKMKKFGTTRLERISQSDQVPKFLALAHDISLQTWQSRRLGLRIRNDEGERAALSALADAGLLRSYLWYSNDEPVAFCVGNQAHGVFHYEEVGYATRFARFSPGQMLVVQMIDDLLAVDRPTWFDFGGGDAEYKRLFANHTSMSGTVWVTPPGLKSRFSLSWIHLCRGMKQAGRRIIASAGLATRVRQWIRYGGRHIAEPEPSDEEPAS